MPSVSYREVDSLLNLPAPDEQGRVSHYVFQYIDFSLVPQYIAAGHRFCDCFFFGCEIPSDMEGQIGSTCLVFPRLGLAYSTFRGKLYTGEELYDGYDPANEETFSTCYDTRVYNSYMEKGAQCNEIRETLGRTLHDRAIQDAMADFLRLFDERQVVAIMGGHAMRRTDPEYRKVVVISKTLTEKGKLMASGGGPGAMEATHLGAWMAGRTPEELDEALSMLEVAPTFRDEGWLRTAFEVKQKFPQNRFRSLGTGKQNFAGTAHRSNRPRRVHLRRETFLCRRTRQQVQFGQWRDFLLARRGHRLVLCLRSYGPDGCRRPLHARCPQ